MADIAEYYRLMDHDEAEYHRLWWEGNVKSLERDLVLAEHRGDDFLARAHRHTLVEAREKLAMLTRDIDG